MAIEQKEELIEATCPECRGPLRAIRYNEIVEYECLVGHKYSAESLLTSHSEVQEKALWSAIVALEEATNIVRATASQLPPEIAQHLEKLAERKREQAQTIRQITEELEPFQSK